MRIGFANGCFDSFHAGHKHFLEECAWQCDYLIVAVNSDEWCRRHKGADRPFNRLWDRLIDVRNFLWFLHRNCAVIPFEGNEDSLILNLLPDIVFRGSDHSLKPHLEALGINVIPVSRLPGVSTTQLALERSQHGQGS